MNIVAKELQKRETKLRIRMNYKNVKSQQKGDYKNVKILLRETIFFIPLQNALLCRKPRQSL